jgi:hypothetical protein
MRHRRWQIKITSFLHSFITFASLILFVGSCPSLLLHHQTAMFPMPFLMFLPYLYFPPFSRISFYLSFRKSSRMSGKTWFEFPPYLSIGGDSRSHLSTKTRTFLTRHIIFLVWFQDLKLICAVCLQCIEQCMLAQIATELLASRLLRWNKALTVIMWLKHTPVYTSAEICTSHQLCLPNEAVSIQMSFSRSIIFSKPLIMSQCFNTYTSQTTWHFAWEGIYCRTRNE